MSELLGIGFEIWSFLFSLIAITIAVAKEVILPLWFKPTILVEYANNEECIQEALIIHRTEIPGDEMITGQNSWLRLKILNKGKTTAKGVYVKLISMKDSKNEFIRPFDPSPLNWTIFHTDKIDLAKGEYHIVDLVYQNIGTDFFIPRAISLPNSLIDKIKELATGRYSFQITVYGDNIEPVSKDIGIIVTGDYTALKFDL